MKVKLVITLMMIAVISFGCGKAENSIPEQEKEEAIVQENEEVSETADTFQKELVEMSKSDVMYSGEIESIDEEYWVDQIASKEEEQKLIEIMKKIPKEDFENAVDYLDMYTLPKEGGLVKFFEDSSKDIVIYGYTCEEFYAKGVIIKDQDVWTYVHSMWDNKCFTEFYLGDYDHDGDIEIAQLSPGAEGSGLFIERLMIFEKQNDGTWEKSQFLYDDQTDQIFQNVKFYKDMANNQFIVETLKDGQITIPWDEAEIPVGEICLDIEHLREFDIKGDQITYLVNCGVYAGIPMWSAEGIIDFEVEYQQGHFSLK